MSAWMITRQGQFSRRSGGDRGADHFDHDDRERIFAIAARHVVGTVPACVC
jgi:hypothetical protein